MNSTRILSTIAESAPQAVLACDLSGRINYANPALANLTGWTVAQLQVTDCARLMSNFPVLQPSPDASASDTRLLSLQAFDTSLNLACGRVLPVRAAVAPIRDETAICGALVSFADARSESELRAALRESEENYRTLVENMLNGLVQYRVLVDEHGEPIDAVFCAANAAFERITGISREAVVGMRVTEVRPDVDQDWVELLGRVALTGEPVSFERHSARLGKWFSMLAYSPRDGFCAILSEDVTERKRAEDGQRLASLGQLAAGVAHEFNNLLAALMMKAELALYRGESHQYRELAEMVLRSARRGAEICRSLTSFSRPREPKRQSTPIQVPIEAALAVLASQLDGAASISIKRDYAVGDACVFGDPAQLEQVFLNLFVNACHAMPDGGTLGVRIRESASPAGRYLVVTVSDTGVGISPEHLSRIFEPFFTTKGRLGESETPGTGLGLSVSHGLIKAHGGTIEAFSEAGQGSQFEVRLPLLVAEQAPVAPPRSTLAVGAPERVLAVLVADDEPDICELVASILHSAACEVTTAADTEQALAALGLRQYDLVIADWLMPGGGGREVAAYAKNLPTPPPVVIITGRVEHEVNEQLLAAGVVKRLQKPFAMADLLQVVDEVRSDLDLS